MRARREDGKKGENDMRDGGSGGGVKKSEEEI